MSRSLALQQLALLLTLAVLFAVFASLSDRFFVAENMRTLLLQSTVVGIAAVGMTLVIMTGGIDLSVGSTMNLAIVVAVAVAGSPGRMEYTTNTTALVYPIALITGCLLGAFNAFLILRLRISPLIATLGTLTLYRGAALHLTNATENLTFGPVRDFARGAFLFDLGLPVYAMAALAAAAAVMLRFSVFGRYVLAVGGSERSARETGLPIAAVLLFVYAAAGFCAAVSGLVVVGRVGAINPDLGWQFEFTAITAAVLGGTSLFGGRGSIVGSVIAAFVLSTISNGLNLIGADPFIYDVVRGAVLLFAVTLDTLIRRSSEAARMPLAAPS